MRTVSLLAVRTPTIGGAVLLFLIGVAVGGIAMLLLVLWIVANRAWRHARFNALHIPFAAVVGMRLRGTPPSLISDAYVALAKRGLQVEWPAVEATYLAHRRHDIAPAELADLVVKDGIAVAAESEVEGRLL